MLLTWGWELKLIRHYSRSSSHCIKTHKPFFSACFCTIFTKYEVVRFSLLVNLQVMSELLFVTVFSDNLVLIHRVRFFLIVVFAKIFCMAVTNPCFKRSNPQLFLFPECT
jgi:hypothetical protein